jgi:hypothetical protein
MTDKNDRYKQNISRAITSGLSFDIASMAGRELESITFSNPLYESSMLRYSSGEEGELTHPYYRFKGYSRLSDKQKCIEEVIRQAEIYHEDQAGINVIKWIQEQPIGTRFRYLSSAGLLFGMKYGSLDIYPYNSKKHEEIIQSFFEKANEASVPPLDVIRYWRKIKNTDKYNRVNYNENIPPILIQNENNSVTIGKSLCNELKNLINDEKNPLKNIEVENPIQLYLYTFSINNRNDTQLKKVIVTDDDGNNIHLSILCYPNDTLDTLKVRYAVENGIPLEMVQLKIAEEDEIESESIIDGVQIQYLSSKEWKNNILENKKCIINSIIDIIESIPIELKNDSTIKKSMNELMSAMNHNLSINKDDCFYIYLIIHYSVFSGNSLLYLNENGLLEKVNVDDVISAIENNISYLELLLVFPIDKLKFKTVIDNYIFSLKNTLELGENYINNNDIENDDEFVMTDLQKIKKLKTSIKSTTIHETNFTINGSFILESIDIFEYFNMLNCNHTIPFANLHHFYKCLNGIKVPMEWCKTEEESENSLRFYINNLDIDTLKDENYSLTIIKQISSEKGINTFEYEIYGTINIDMDVLLKKFISVLPYKPQSLTVKKEFGKGLYCIQNLPFFEELFFDYCSNEKCVSEMISIDEKYKIHKIRGGLKFSIHLNRLDNSNVLKCIMKQKLIEKNTDIEVKLFPQFVKVGSNITVLQISGSINNHLLQYYKTMLLQFFTYIQLTYYHKYVKYYCNKVQNIIPLITPPISKPIIKDLQLKDIAPDLFLSGYVRSCSYPPSIISDEEKENAIKKGFDVMTYPALNNSNNLNSFHYICDKDKKKIYPGLRINDMDNSEIYPAVPCCYQDIQNTEGTIRYKYEHNIPLISETSGAGTFITTRKILKATQEGALPSAIKNLLTMTDDSSLLGESIFIRIAVPRSNWSIIDALKLATNSKLSTDQIIEKCKEYVRMNLLSQSNLSIQEALNIINSKSYMSIQDWCNIFEIIFNVNIIIFLGDKDDTEGQISHQNYKRYLILNPSVHYNNAVLIFNTYGGEFDKTEYPHNEVIVKRSVSSSGKKKDYISLFPTNSETFSAIQMITKNLINYQSISNSLPISKQSHDGYGKIREIVVDNIICYTSPISPSILIKEQQKNILKKLKIKNNPKDILDFIKKYNIQNVQKILHNNTCIGIIGDYITSENNYFQIIIRSEVNDSNEYNILKNFNEYNIQKYGYPIPPSDIESFLKTYNHYNRLTSYIISYCCYLFSLLHSEKNISIEEFESKHFIINPNHNYGELQRLLHLNKNNIIKNNKCIVPSEDIKIRIIFYIQMLNEYNPDVLINYHYNKYIPNYYTNAEDFKKSIDYSIYNNLEEYLETRRLKKAQYALYEILFKSSVSYFYSNFNLSTQYSVYLAIPSITKEQAISRSTYFKKYKKILLYPPYDEEEYKMITQDNNGIYISKDNIDDIIIGRLIINKTKPEDNWFSLIPIK